MTNFNFKRLFAISMFMFLFSFGPAIYLLLFGKDFSNIKQLLDNGIYFNSVYILLPLLFVKFNWHIIDPGSKINFNQSNFFKIYGLFLVLNAIALIASSFFGF